MSSRLSQPSRQDQHCELPGRTSTVLTVEGRTRVRFASARFRPVGIQAAFSKTGETSQLHIVGEKVGSTLREIHWPQNLLCDRKRVA